VLEIESGLVEQAAGRPAILLSESKSSIKQRRKKDMSKLSWRIVAVVMTVFVLGMALGWARPLPIFRPETASAQPVLYNEDTVTTIYDNASPAVVEVDVTLGTAMMGAFFGQGEGSGFLIDSDGSILTNNHVVDGASKVTIAFNNGGTADASVIGTDAVHDLALIKVDPSVVSGVSPLMLGDSSTVRPGQMAIAIGAPYGLANSITVGVISGLDRSISGSSMTSMLQTDAELNPGNSGGPLLNASGEVIGINTAVEAQPGAYGIGFAVPSNVAKSVLPTLRAGKQVQRLWLGISGRALTADLAKQLNLSVNQGVYVINVTSGSPADKVGLKGSGISSGGVPTTGGDVITAVDGNAVKSVSDLSNYFASKQVGDQVTLSVVRGGNTMNVQPTLGA
jgi:S1-C subfamily serine protease